jgi:hypothetical protein
LTEGNEGFGRVLLVLLVQELNSSERLKKKKEKGHSKRTSERE